MNFYMFEDILKPEMEKIGSEVDFKILFCSICSEVKECKFTKINECIKDFNESANKRFF